MAHTQNHHHHDNPISRLVGKLRRGSDGGNVAEPNHRGTDKKSKKMIRAPSFRSSQRSLPPSSSYTRARASSSAAADGGRRGSTESNHDVPDAVASLDLWSTAYDDLRDRPASAGLVVAYESIVAQELPAHCKVGGINTTLRDHPDSRRLDLVSHIASAGLRKRRASKGDNSGVDEEARAILEDSKDTVEIMLNAYPSAALAWCGICALTPLLLDPLIRSQNIRGGVLRVTGRISWYMFLTQLLLPESWRHDTDFRAHAPQARDLILAQYRRVLEYEMNCVCATATSWNMAAKNVVGPQALGKLDAAIREADAEIARFVERYCTEGVAERLLALDKDLEVPADVLSAPAQSNTMPTTGQPTHLDESNRSVAPNIGTGSAVNAGMPAPGTSSTTASSGMTQIKA